MKQFISYAKYGNLIERLVGKIKPVVSEFCGVHGIPRGGLPIAVHLSHHLDLPYIEELPDEMTDVSKKILIVDDLTHTGKTFKELIVKMRLHGVNYGYEFATLFHKHQSIVVPRHYVEVTTDWIVFPYERDDEIPNRED